MIYTKRARGVILVLGICLSLILSQAVIGSDLSAPERLRQRPVENPLPGGDIKIAPMAGHSPFVAVAEAVRPAVVNISAESVVKERPQQFDEFFRQFFGLPPGSTPEQPQAQKMESLGSGFIIRPDGYIMTNNHIVEGAEKVTVILPDGQRYKADIVGRDQETDIAIIRIKADAALPTIPMGNSDSILVGDWVLAVGNPFPTLGLSRTVTVGVVSAKGREGLSFGEENPSFQSYIQTDASINPGNSGGPLVDIHGQVVGVNSAIATPSGGSVGIGFAVPINMARNVADQLIKTGKIARGYLGVIGQDITQDLKAANNLPNTEGVLVAQVDRNSPADKAGIRVGDIIAKFNDKPITDAQQFRFLIADAKPGTDINFGIWREGSEKNIRVRLGDRGEMLAQAQKQQERQDGTDHARDGKADGKAAAATPWGITAQTFTQGMADQIGIDFVPGAIITEIDPGSPADNSGLQPGDVILKVGEKEIRSASEFMSSAKQLEKSSRPVSFYIKRGLTNMYVAVSAE